MTNDRPADCVNGKQQETEGGSQSIADMSAKAAAIDEIRTGMMEDDSLGLHNLAGVDAIDLVRNAARAGLESRS